MNESIPGIILVAGSDTGELAQWRFHACSAKPAMPAFQISRMWRLGYTVLLKRSATTSHISRACWLLRTRQTILLHFLHSPTISRAQGPTLPLVKRLDVLFVRYICGAALLPDPAASSGVSFSQHNVKVLSIVRYCSRFARNWRHVRDRSCSVLRSSRLASCETMLLQSVRSCIREALCVESQCRSDIASRRGSRVYHFPLL